MHRSPKVSYGLFLDNETEGLYLSKSDRIVLDCLYVRSSLHRFHILLHEFIHHLTTYLPDPLERLIDLVLDMTDGNDPEIRYRDTPEITVLLYEW